MRTAMLLPLACLSIQAADPWATAQAAFRKEIQPGYVGCLIHLERLDATTLRVRISGQDLRFGMIEGEPLGNSAYGFRARALRGSADFQVVTLVPESASALRLKLQGEEIATEIVLNLPRPGATGDAVLQFEGTPGGAAGSKSH
ncbi:MAG TPA: hypothetical protein VJ570_10345 [Holophagaceae bacterium]|nr:hypothetical protein [Holophagaceae bacterium]